MSKLDEFERDPEVVAAYAVVDSWLRDHIGRGGTAGAKCSFCGTIHSSDDLCEKPKERE